MKGAKEQLEGEECDDRNWSKYIFSLNKKKNRALYYSIIMFGLHSENNTIIRLSC